jgi:hypothetical protein
MDSRTVLDQAVALAQVCYLPSAGVPWSPRTSYHAGLGGMSGSHLSRSGSMEYFECTPHRLCRHLWSSELIDGGPGSVQVQDLQAGRRVIGI